MESVQMEPLESEKQQLASSPRELLLQPEAARCPPAADAPGSPRARRSANATVGAPRSLKARALQWLAQREQSRAELRRKLLPHALAQAEAAARESSASLRTPGDTTSAQGMTRAQEQPVAAVEQVDALLDWLEAHSFLCDERFVESRVHARSPRFGNLRIRRELQQHGLALPPEAAQSLRESEVARACAVRERKFTEAAPANLSERAKQARFLAGRGFSPESISLVLRRAGLPANRRDGPHTDDD